MKIIDRLRDRARELKNEILAISLAFKDERTPLPAKIMIGITVSYALSPIDVVPDFIPIIGYLDDLIILPALIMISIKLIPDDVLNNCRTRIKDGYTVNKKTGWIAAVLIVLFWAAMLGLIIF